MNLVMRYDLLDALACSKVTGVFLLKETSVVNEWMKEGKQRWTSKWNKYESYFFFNYLLLKPDEFSSVQPAAAPSPTNAEVSFHYHEQLTASRPAHLHWP